MNIKDIQTNKYYSYAIWDNEAVFYKCIGKEDGYFMMQECPYYGYDYNENPEEVYPMLIEDIDKEEKHLIEIHEMQYVIRSMGLLIEKQTIKIVLDNKDKL